MVRESLQILSWCRAESPNSAIALSSNILAGDVDVNPVRQRARHLGKVLLNPLRSATTAFSSCTIEAAEAGLW